MRAALAAAWLTLRLPSSTAKAAPPGLTPGLAAELPVLTRTGLDYCPPIEVSFVDFACVDNSSRAGFFAFLFRRAEEVLWAIANAREAGRLGLGKTGGSLSFLESAMLLLCWMHLDCAFQGDKEAESYWVSQFIVRCREMQMRAPAMPPEENAVDLCMDLEFLNSVLAHVRSYVLSEANQSEEGDAVHAVYPPDVSPACKGRTGAVLGPMRPLTRREVPPDMYTLSVAMKPLVAMMGLVIEKGPGGFVVNLGASDGECQAQGVVMDAANCAFDSGARGVAVEGRRGWALDGRWPSVEVHSGYITPWNVSEIIKASLKSQGAKAIDLLKIDLDHADCTFAEEILRRVPTPRALHVEYNRALPPPIIFREHFSERTLDSFAQVDDSWHVFGSRRHWIGCSMQAWNDVVAPHGFELLQADFQDLIFIQAGLRDQLGIEMPPQRSLFDHWLDAVHCTVPGRYLHGLQHHARFDLRALAEAGPQDRCRLAAAWWAHEGDAELAELSC